MASDQNYWVIEARFFAFESEGECCDFRDALMDTFEAVPLSDAVGASWRVFQEDSDDGVKAHIDAFMQRAKKAEARVAELERMMVLADGMLSEVQAKVRLLQERPE